MNELLRAADLLLVIGCKLGAAGTGGRHLDVPRERVVRVDASPTAFDAAHPAALEIVATAEACLAEVGPAVALHRAAAHPSWPPAEIEAWRRRLRTQTSEAEPAFRGARPAKVATFFAQMRAALPRDAIVVADSGLHQTLLRRHFDVLAPRGLLLPTDFQSMGFGLPAAIGAKLARPDRAVLAVVGDGGFRMTGLELGTAVRLGTPSTGGCYYKFCCRSQPFQAKMQDRNPCLPSIRTSPEQAEPSFRSFREKLCFLK